MGVSDPACPVGRSTLSADIFGQEGSASEPGMSFHPWRLGTHPLEGKEGQLDSDHTFFPCYQWRN